MGRLLDPQKIEDKSFEIIESLLPTDLKLTQEERQVLRRVIHATTELGYAKELIFHPQAVESGLRAIRQGKDVICDVDMVRVGINNKILSGFGGKVICLINDDEVVKEARQLKIARAIVAMRRAVKLINGAIVSIGNAPTALFELCELVRKGKVKPSLIIGVPVGFVGAQEAKKELLSIGIPYVTNSSTKGGSSVAAAITNAMLKLAEGGDQKGN